jgi:hypothetical protein
VVSRLFISYRRDDSAGYAGRLYDRLEREFGRDHLVMDVDAIPLGANFVKVLGDEVAKCDLLLAIIGPGWLEARDEEGNRRLENPQDFVRIEIGTALKRGIPVIPILLEGTRIPKADQLPDDLKELPLRNGLNVRHVSFLDDLERLIRGLKREARRKAEEEAPRKAAEEAEARRKAEEEAQRKAAEEAEARRKAEEEAHRKAAEEARRKAEEEAQRKAAEEARRKAEEEAQRKAAEQAKAQETREWGLVISSRDKKVIQNFLERWPHSQRADAARARIGALEREAAEAEARRKAEEERKLQADAARARIVALERAPGEPGAASQLVQEPADWRTVAKRAVLGTVAIGALVLALLALSWLPARQSSVPGPSQSQPTKPASSESLEPARPDQALSVQPGSGQSLRDRLANGQLCPRCPEMVVVPKGVFTMGSPASEPQRDIDENPLLSGNSAGGIV